MDYITPKEDPIYDSKTNSKVSYCLTRYLYIKTAVIRSLIISLDFKCYESAIYWAYELYRSGFQTECVNYLMGYLNAHYDTQPKFIKSMTQRYKKWKSDYKSNETFVATLIKNMCLRKNKCMDGLPNIIVDIKIGQIAYTNTKKINLPQHYLEEVVAHYAKPLWTGYEDITEFENNEQALAFIRSNNWLYHASHTPLWKARIEKYGGKIYHETQKVEFDTDEISEVFYDKFGFNPCEQTLDLQYALAGISI